MVSRGVHEGILYPQGTLFRRYVHHTGVGSHSTSSHTGQSQVLNSGRVELEAYAFRYGVQENNK